MKKGVKDERYHKKGETEVSRKNVGKTLLGYVYVGKISANLSVR